MLRIGPYASAVLRFNITYPEDYPERPPVITFATDIFHPSVTPLTTYTYTTIDSGAETVSAADEDRLPPGGLSLRHGFPKWFTSNTSHGRVGVSSRQPHIVEILHYMRAIFDNEAILDSIPLETAANTGAWHAWQSYRTRATRARAISPSSVVTSSTESSGDSSTAARQQPGGARRPGEWNWTGVWEDRVRKSVQASISDAVLYGSAGAGSEVINFSPMDQEALAQASIGQRPETAS